jgi:hypothetical protein
MSDNEKMGVGVGTGVSGITRVFVGLGVRIGVAVPVGVTVGVFVGIAVPVGVAVGVFVGVAVQVARTTANVAASASLCNVIWSLTTKLARQQKTRKTAVPSPMRMVICCLVITMHQLSC